MLPVLLRAWVEQQGVWEASEGQGEEQVSITDARGRVAVAIGWKEWAVTVNGFLFQVMKIFWN